MILTAHLLVVGAERLDQVAEGKPEGGELAGIDQHLELLFETAPGGDVVDARRRAQQQPHRPILHRAQIRGRRAALRRIERVPEHLAEAGGVGAKLGFAVARRNALLGFRQLLARQPPREIDVDIVLEINRDVGEPEQRDRADLLDARQARHGRLDRCGQQRLDILGGKAGTFRVDVDLNGRDVGKRVDRHQLKGAHAEDDDKDEGDQDEHLVAQRQIDECGQHGGPSVDIADLRFEQARFQRVSARDHHLDRPARDPR